MIYTTNTDFFNTYNNNEECIKIPNISKKNVKKNKEVNHKKLDLRKKDGIHSHKNMRKQNKDWKDFNQSLNFK